MIPTNNVMYILYSFLFGLILPNVIFASELPAVIENITAPSIVHAPEFSLSKLDGSRIISLAAFKGQVIFLNFWATWCAPCRQEMLDLEKLWLKYCEQGLVVLAVSEDTGGSSQRVKYFASMQKLTYHIVLDADGKVGKAYGVSGLPMSYLIGKDGQILAKIQGSRDWTSKTAELFIEQMLRNN